MVDGRGRIGRNEWRNCAAHVHYARSRSESEGIPEREPGSRTAGEGPGMNTYAFEHSPRPVDLDEGESR